MRRNQPSEAVAGFDDPLLAEIRDQARNAMVARRKTFLARLPLPDNATAGDVPFWSAAVQQIEQNNWKLGHWSVCPEGDGPVAYAVFTQ